MTDINQFVADEIAHARAKAPSALSEEDISKVVELLTKDIMIQLMPMVYKQVNEAYHD